MIVFSWQCTYYYFKLIEIVIVFNNFKFFVKLKNDLEEMVNFN